MATVATLRAALRDARALRESGVDGISSLYVNGSIRDETLRLIKHAIVLSAIFAIEDHVRDWLASVSIDPIVYRNACLILIGLLLGLNSILDLRSRRKSPESPAPLRKN